MFCRRRQEGGETMTERAAKELLRASATALAVFLEGLAMWQWFR